VTQPKAAPKKANAAADSKKKWMRRIWDHSLIDSIDYMP
jgi:hypothetical protein